MTSSIRLPPRFLWILALTMLAMSGAEAQNASLEAQMLDDIKEAQANLNRVENQIAKERARIVSSLNALERDVLALQDKAGAATRLADEQTLSLSKLEERLDRWRQQNTYQKNLLARFLQQHSDTKLSDINANELPALMEKALSESRHYEDRFFPYWRESTLIASSGQIVSVPVLSLGPVTWYWDEDSNEAGYANRGQDGLLEHHASVKTGSGDIEALLSDPTGFIVFDPTLTRATAAQEYSESVLEHLSKGGFWILPILAFALFALSIAIFKAYQLFRMPAVVRIQPSVLNALMRGETVQHKRQALDEKIKGMQMDLLNCALASNSPRQRDDDLFLLLQDQKQFLDRWIGGIAITAAVSPLLGLLGTVSGMIETFQMMTLFGSGDPEVVSGGIAQALVTTELGLVVAIPALVLNALLMRRARSYYSDLEAFALSLSQAGEVALSTPNNAENQEAVLA